MTLTDRTKKSTAHRTDFLRSGREVLAGPVGTIAIGLIVVIAVGLILVGGIFLSESNISIIGSFAAVPIIIGACSAFALLAGVVDLSIGSMVGFSAAVFAQLYSQGWNGWAAAGVCVVLSAAFGAVNAVAIVTFGADPIAATLGMLAVLRGACLVLNGDTGSIAAFIPSLLSFIDQRIGPFPLLFVFSLLVVAVAAIVVNRTRLGRHIRAVGGDERAARRAGMSVAKIRYGALVISAIGACVGGILYVGQLGGAANTLGIGLEFQVYAALMIGGYSILRGGIGNPVGGLFGLLVVAGVSNILDVKAINTFYTDVIVGVLLLAAVLLDRLRGGESYE